MEKKKRGRPPKKKEDLKEIPVESVGVKPEKKEDDIKEDNILTGISDFAKKELNISVFTLDQKKKYDFLTTGLMSLDDIIGGGYPSGKIIEIYGPEGCGKSSLWQWCMVQNSNKDTELKTFVLDAENSIDKKYLLSMGLKNIQNIRYSTVNSIRKGFSLLRVASRHGCKLIVLDSIAVLSPITIIEDHLSMEEEKELLEKQRIGHHAQLVSEELRSLMGVISEMNSTFLIINQLRTKFIKSFISTVTTTGGWALKFYSHIRMNMEVLENTKDYLIIKVDTEKNKIHIPFRQTRIKLLLGKGFDTNFDKVQYLFQNNIIEYVDKGRYLYKGKKYFWKDLEDMSGELEESCLTLMETKKK